MNSGRVALELLLKRLETEFGHLRPKDFCGWQDEYPAVQKLTNKGAGHFAAAIKMARAALATGQEQQIADAAIHCQALERVGREVAARSSRRRGAGVSGQHRADAADQAWAPWINEFLGLVREGMDQATARHRVQVRMGKTGFKLPTTGKPPSARAIRHRLVIN